MRNAFSDALVARAKADPKVLLLTGDHGYALFDAFRKACPDQYINCGIAEQNMVGVAAGLARAGFKPVVYGLAAFVPVRVLEQIKIDVCYENLPVILIGDGAGFVYSHLGTSHQSTEDIACTRTLPSLTVLSPADRFEMAGAMELAFASNSPVYLRMGKSDRGDIHTEAIKFSTGKILPLHKTEKPVAILATGSMVRTALSLSEEIEAEVWSVPTIKPIDRDQLLSIARRVSCIVTIEEHSILGGLGSCVTETLSSEMPVPVCRVGVEDRFSSKCGTWDYLLIEHGLDLESVSRRVNSFLNALPEKQAAP